MLNKIILASKSKVRKEILDKNNIENTILHISDSPLTNSEPFVSNVKVFICDRWSWFLKRRYD